MSAAGKIAFIGGGNMTQAIAAGLRDGDFDMRSVAIADPHADTRVALAKALPGALVLSDNDEAAASADCVVLAVKPQVLRPVCLRLADRIQQERPLIMSIAAGVRVADIDDWLGGGLAIVRVMPNQPALIREGASGMFGNERVTAAELARATDIMQAVGTVVTVPQESDMDAVTAVSGSGPAYFYYLCDVLAATGESMGLSAETATRLALATARGAAQLASDSGESLATLTRRVRSPGGTTAAALDTLDEAGARDIFAAAIRAARDRAEALADEAHSQTGQD